MQKCYKVRIHYKNILKEREKAIYVENRKITVLSSKKEQD